MGKKPQKKTRKNYDYYTLNIPNELRMLYEAYITKYSNLGFKSVSQYLLHILQTKAEKIMKNNPDFKKIEEFRLHSSTYLVHKNGKNKKNES
ncbi:MAG: hypothetical protein ACFFHV_11945 [Promethearchaeota archaeon]